MTIYSGGLLCSGAASLAARYRVPYYGGEACGGAVGLAAGLRAVLGRLLPEKAGGGAGGGDPVPVPVALPVAWSVVPLPESGYIGPVMAQLALVRGAAAVYSGGGLLVGGARLVGPAGKVYAFSTQGAGDMWAAINRARGVREVELLAGLDAAGAEVWLVKKRAQLAKVAASVVNAAARCADSAIAAALIAESNFCLTKWAA